MGEFCDFMRCKDFSSRKAAKISGPFQLKTTFVMSWRHLGPMRLRRCTMAAESAKPRVRSRKMQRRASLLTCCDVCRMAR